MSMETIEKEIAECQGKISKDCLLVGARELHSCPYQEDVNNDPSENCNCCAECQQECADAI